ncbi:MAG: hypothetical protein K9K81_04050 [Desulfobacteraceae bacterium]|nr:hypothetical protein [Desulfobacteraceae bacterium]
MTSVSEPSVEIKITVAENRLSLMRLVFGYGIQFKVPAGTRVSNFLQQALCTDADYIENRIQTLFMDGRAVDDPESEEIHSPCTLAVSAAMPGVFGAAFRKQGTYSGLRRHCSQIRQDQENRVKQGRIVAVTVKCFNQVAADLGNELLEAGVVMNLKDFLDFWARQGSILEKDNPEVQINHTKIHAREVTEILCQKTGTLRIQINAANTNGG